MSKYEPMLDRVLVRRLDTETQTPGGIFVPQTAQEKKNIGKVVAVGPGRRKDDGTYIPIALNEGDTVMFGKYVGSEIDVEGEKLVLVREEEVLCTIEE